MDWNANDYHVAGYPTTFVIGADGRRYFRPRLINDAEERAAELEIEALLGDHEVTASVGLWWHRFMTFV
jgi:hypothetical protein